MLGISALNNTPLQLRSKVGCFVGILAAFLFIAGAADAQLKFPDGSVQSTAFGGTNNTASGTDATVGGGVDNIASGDISTVSGGSTNTAGGEASTVGGGFGNQALFLDSTVGGGSLNISSATNAVVSGGTLNMASGVSSVVAGGEDNIASAQNATVGGGQLNEAAELNATIAGGTMNLASGDSSTIAGGYFNDANDLDATVGGGSENIASGLASTISGGSLNIASGVGATIPGGSDNIAAGALSFATGFGATVEAAHPGTVLFADSNQFFFFSNRANEFAVRSTGGVRFVTSISGVNGEPLSGVKLNPGGGTWLNLSDKNAKENVRPVDTESALDEVLALPINTWNYKTQDPGIRHMGPMAQDFYAAFGLGTDERHIGTVDADGAALAAIQGLHHRMRAENDLLRGALTQKDAVLARLQSENTVLAARLDALERIIFEGSNSD